MIVIICDTRINTDTIDSYGLKTNGSHERYLSIVCNGTKHKFKFTYRDTYKEMIDKLDSILGARELRSVV